MTNTECAAKINPDVSVQILSGLDWLASVVSLHVQVRIDMGEAKRPLLLPKKPAYFADLLNQKTGVLFGAFAGETMIGEMAVMCASNLADARAKNYITCPLDDGQLVTSCHQGRVAVIQSIGVLDGYKGLGVSQSLIEAGTLWTQQSGHKHVFAQVGDSNHEAKQFFYNQRFGGIAQWTPSGEHTRVLMRWGKRLAVAQP